MAKPPVHDDFGEKIGGAKKDLWKREGLHSADVDGLNSREADKYVKKDYIWKKPDYEALIASGVPVDVAYFRKTVRDSLSTAPAYRRADDTPEKRLARQKQYIDTVRQVQTVVEKVETRADVMAVFDKCMMEPGYFTWDNRGISRSSPTATAAVYENPAITNKLISTVFIRSETAYDYNVVRAAGKAGFGIPADEKPPRGYDVRHNDGKNIWSKDDDWKPGTWYVTKGRAILQTNLASKADAAQWARDYAKQRGGSGKQRYTPPQLAHMNRDGPDYRGGRNVTGQQYLDTFGFRGGEFGNWMSQNDRRASLNMGYDALKDLADALKITDKDVSYQGALSIAFGARGGGKAVAHYEPTRQVINLTKMRGAGSLAHEWWHGLDDYLGQKFGTGKMLSDTPHKHPLMKKLIDAIKHKPETLEQAVEREKGMRSRSRANAERCLQSMVGDTIQRYGNEKMKAEYESIKEAFLAGEDGDHTQKLSALKKSVTGRVIPADLRSEMDTHAYIMRCDAKQTEPKISTRPTDYYTASRKMAGAYEKDGGYWDSNIELTARAFATYVMDKLDGRSDYLVGHAESAVAMVPGRNGDVDVLQAFPVGAERQAIHAAFDELIDELKRESILTHDDRPPPEPEPTLLSQIRSRVPSGPVEQLSLFDTPSNPDERPSVLARLAVNQAAAKQKGPEPTQKNKAHKREETR